MQARTENQPTPTPGAGGERRRYMQGELVASTESQPPQELVASAGRDEYTKFCVL